VIQQGEDLATLPLGFRRWSKSPGKATFTPFWGYLPIYGIL